ncbi:MAG: hypothetical protein CTY29_11835 [Methylobacter sp.]|nr:MAG: hypothetical protein CTY29_11835 [Methylobacter sp.]
MTAITPCLWFDNQAEQAATFYTGIFKNSAIKQVSYHTEAGSVLTVAFELDGQAFTALNGGPVFRFSEALSLQVYCDTQDELDHYWEKLSAGGDPNAQQCGWLKDRFGVSWQILPSMLPELMADSTKSGKVMAAMLTMKKLDIAQLLNH